MEFIFVVEWNDVFFIFVGEIYLIKFNYVRYILILKAKQMFGKEILSYLLEDVVKFNKNKAAVKL